WKGFDFGKMHLLSHSSGSWLVNRMMQLKAPSASIHLTLFDAFTNPSESGFCLPYCGRFEAELGAGGGPDEFIEHYVDRSAWSPPGTCDRLAEAVNFDVSALFRPAVRPSEMDLVDWVKCIADSHGWPYVWYLNTVRSALSGAPPGEDYACGGFILSPEYL